MAEGGGLTSIDHGSDAYFEYTCSPCGEDHIREAAVKYCAECQEYLCTTCTRHHGRQKITRSHTLIDCNASMKAPEVKMITKCRYHPDRAIEMYCEEHDMVYCTMCVVKEHRSCRGISSLKDMNVSSNQQKFEERLNTVTTDIQKRLEDTEQKIKTELNSIEEQKSDVISKIGKIEQDLIKHIRKLKQEALKTLERENTMVKESLVTNVSQIRKVKVEMKQKCQQLQSVDNLDKRQQFIQTKLIQQTVNEALKIIKENEDKVCQHLFFTENKELKSSIMTSLCIGHLQNVKGSNSPLVSKVYKVSSKKEINVKMANENMCYINDICQLPNGSIILSDYSNQRIKRLDVNYNIKDYCDVGDYPTGICCTGNTEVAVKLANNKVQFISVGSSLSKLREISVIGGDYCGIAYYAGELWVSTESGVDVYSMTGTILKTISKDVNGQKIFKSTTQCMAISGDTVIVTDSSDGAVCLRRDGMVIRELRDERITTAKSVCLYNDRTVFIAGYGSDNIVMFDSDGKCLGELTDKDVGLIKPLSLCCDKNKNCVLVCNSLSNALVVFNLSD